MFVYRAVFKKYHFKTLPDILVFSLRFKIAFAAFNKSFTDGKITNYVTKQAFFSFFALDVVQLTGLC
jgi:hypothetical protein